MRTVVVVRGAVDERDLWPYASLSESGGGRSTLTVTVHDSQELVGVLSSLTALGLEVISTHLIEESGGDRRRQRISSSENDAAAGAADDSDDQ
jgi:hypothetical protein